MVATQTPSVDVATRFVSRTQELLPLIARLAGEAEARRRIPAETVQAFADMDFFRVMVPRRYNGFELDISAVTAVGRLVGRHCASSGWVITWLGWHSHAVAMYPGPVQDRVFRDGYGLVAGTPAPVGRVTRVRGGYRVTGRWSWATAVHHADWIVVGGTLAPEQRHMGMLIPITELVIQDNWHTDGMRGTGSDDVEARDVFVPEDYAIDRATIADGSAPGYRWNEGPLYRAPRNALASLVAGAAGIGLGEWAVDDFRERLNTRALPNSPMKQGTSPIEQARLADVTAAMRAAVLLYDEAVDVTARTCRGEHQMSAIERAQVRVWVAHAVAMARETILRIADASGSRAHFLDDPLQRAVRDINTLSSHVVFNRDRAGEVYGKVALGLEYDPAVV